MNAEFNWWLLIVGLVVGAGLVWYVVTDARRRETDLESDEWPREAAWLASVLEREGQPVHPRRVERILALHRVYLDAAPPDDPAGADDPAAVDDPMGPVGQEPPSRTGSSPVIAPDASTSDTPNRTDPPAPATAGDGPTQ